MFTEPKIKEIINMKQKITLCILLNFMLIMLASCSSIREPDIVLKENGQPCISIPRSEDMLRTNRPFNITSTHIYQTSIRSYLSEKYYQEEQYYVKAQECIDFEYHFRNDITYDIAFRTQEKGKGGTSWIASIRIVKDKDGNSQL
ncbi:putative T6SS immunity periplasmic lipoprotein [Snodgrassella alvi]|uniref:putative T6SS immunity periplasmic lipoprotein n=1 Tax=Snodgrassella alvi TaxID=1196083 RepID=UPI003D040D53